MEGTVQSLFLDFTNNINVIITYQVIFFDALSSLTEITSL